MKAEYTREDFAKAIKNPFYEEFNIEALVAVDKKDYALFEQIASEHEHAAPEDVMSRCLSNYAEELRNFEG